MAKRLMPQNISSATGEELVRRIGLASLEPLGSEWASEPVHVIPHPTLKPSER
jgi:hypothetical protein